MRAMITFTHSKKTGVRATVGSVSVDEFPEGDAKTDATITLLALPEAEPTADVISWPGEYEKEGIAIRGVAHGNGEQVSFTTEIDDARVAFLSAPLHDFSDHELELLGNVDVLVLPASNVKLAQKLIDEIDPRVLIPVVDQDEAVYTELLIVSGAQDKEVEKEFKLKGLPAEGRVVVVLQQ